MTTPTTPKAGDITKIRQPMKTLETYLEEFEENLMSDFEERLHPSISRLEIERIEISLKDFYIVQAWFSFMIDKKKDFLATMYREVREETKEAIVEEFGEYRLIKKFGLGLIKYGRTLRFYLSPHTKHKEGDDDFTF